MTTRQRAGAFGATPPIGRATAEDGNSAFAASDAVGHSIPPSATGHSPSLPPGG
jgi:hypothetical protein